MNAAERVMNILEHHGVKGMKWGVRRREKTSAVTVSDKRVGKKLKAKGGYNVPTHEHAVRARTTGQIKKKSGVKALSDEELTAYAKRLRLEQEVARLEKSNQNHGRKFVDKLIGRSGDQAANEIATQGTKKVATAIAARQALKVAAVAA